MKDRLNVGVIGIGRMGRLHAGHLAQFLPEARLSWIVDAATERAADCATALNVPNTSSNYRDLLNDDSVEAVFICASTDVHEQMISDSAAAGKHIFCEKPIGSNLVEIDKSLKVVGEAGVKLQIGFNRRFDPGFRRAREYVRSGRIGVPWQVRITSRDPAPPPIAYIKSSGGMFFDMTIHDFDMCRFLINDEVSEIYAVGETLVDPEIGAAGDVDTAVITLSYSGGAIGVIENSRKAVYGYDQRVEVFGSEGCVTVGNVRQDSSELSTTTGILTALPQFFFVERYTESYLNEARAFLKSVIEGSDTPVSGDDGRAAVVLAQAAQLSFREHRPVQPGKS